MRQHLFRGIREDTHEWVDGHYYTQVLLEGTIEEEWYHFIKPIGSESSGEVRVIPETISEYTGIHDKNGKKIFENDIVRTQPFYDRPFSSQRKGKQFIGVVEYTIRKFNGNRFYPEQTYDARWRVNISEDIGKYVHSSWSDFWGCEVIGNVFENSELLEG